MCIWLANILYPVSGKASTENILSARSPDATVVQPSLSPVGLLVGICIGIGVIMIIIVIVIIIYVIRLKR